MLPIVWEKMFNYKSSKGRFNGPKPQLNFNIKKGVPSAESSRSAQGLGKDVSGKTATRTQDLPVTGGKTLPLAPGPPFHLIYP